ncbi:5-histidylcysteine sulfoxide synthase [Marinicella gelatinilytica]|uniref:5-histidylcysteine sulfoxide synthase n=1 Tax=Marinicella gelatinilytica TaxID=2996017 RepID=UPI002260F4D9|nr:5-histidylcysteine sulfoxide synthase [Marinicella gelatinilytica]MCX7544009.1 5-histidylcysteine sulfoxide synthase [Marinicella gelatinilytica]
MTLSLTPTPIIDHGDSEQIRQTIKKHFLSTYEGYEKLFSLLKNDQAYYEQPEPLRHPLIFYLAHTAVFFVNKLRVAKIIESPVNTNMESMMAIGVDEMSWDDLNSGHYDWPSVQAVYDYRHQVKQLVLQQIEQLPIPVPIQWQDPFWVILMGIEHERIHLETSSVLIRQLDLKFIEANADWTHCQDTGQAPDNQLLTVPEGLVKQGRSLPSETYGWDNEYGQQNTQVAEFQTAQFLVSNKEFLAFVEADGYHDSAFWCEEGWQWRQFTQAEHPTFWRQHDEQWLYRSLCEEIPMPWSWPVDVNYHEAKAFCRWLSNERNQSLRLPTEAEWIKLYQHTFPREQKSHYPHWTKAPGNIDLQHHASACPVDKFRFGEQRFGDVIGNVWQWTETAIDGFSGFKVHPVYDDFSVPTFDGRHNLIKGGSFISTGNEAHRQSRYAFRRHFFQHAGFRYVHSDHEVSQQFNTYETDELIAQYLEFHYGDQYHNVANFPKACIDFIMPHIDASHRQRALDLGCAVGRSSFELARYFEHVDAVDFSARFIQNAIKLVEHGEIKYLITDEGELQSLKTFHLSDLDLDERIQNIDFSQGDACNLKPKYREYDLVFAGNLIDRLYQPEAFLRDIMTRINAGGYLAITSPYTWLEEFTEREHWLGGYKENGENVTTLDSLQRILGEQFEAVCDPADIPFVIRETARKHQHTIAQLTLWRKRA